MSQLMEAKPRWVQRTKWTQTDGAEREEAYIHNTYHLGADELEALGREALRVAAEWRKEIAERVATPPTHKVFAFSYNGRETKIATWVEHPWVLVRVGKGTSIAFLAKGPDTFGAYQAYIAVAEKNVDGTLRWKLRYECASTVNRSELLFVFPCELPWSPSSGDLELARLRAAKAQGRAA